jgi:hypothetical protein
MTSPYFFTTFLSSTLILSIFSLSLLHILEKR